MVKATVSQKGRRIAWKTADASVRGSSHVRSGLPNQDAAASSVIPGDADQPTTAIVAVSDGHGGARHFRSQVGSALAANIAISALRDFLVRFSAPGGAASLTQAHLDELMRSLVGEWTEAVVADLASKPITSEELERLEAQSEDAYASVEESPLLAYGATLLIAAATDELLVYLQLGDGEILSVSADGVTSRPLPEDDRLVGNQTTSLCQPDAWSDFRSAWVVAPHLPSLVLLSTDGYVNSFRSDDDFLKIGADYLQILREQGISTLSSELPAILDEATRQGSGDDITLAILQGNLARSSTGTRPPLSTGSRSALIEQLKARHSSQDRRIEELSSRLEQTSKSNRRLRNLVIILVLCALAAGAWFYRDRLFHPGQGPVAHPQVDGKHKASGHDLPAIPSSSQPVADRQWLLSIANGPAIPLKKGATFAQNDVAPGHSSDEYAEVAEQKGVIILINLSKDSWKARTGSGKAKTVNSGEHVVLGSDPIEVTFSKGVGGKITPIAPEPQSSPPEIPAASGGIQ